MTITNMPKKIDHSKVRTWIEIDKSAVEHNYNFFRGLIRTPSNSPYPRGRTKLLAVCKSNAYGHGIYDYAPLMDKLGVDWFGVDSITEALTMRDKGIKKPILILGYTLPSRLREAIERDISITVSTFEMLHELERFHYATKKFKVHLKIDTGMHRQGFFPDDVDKLTDVVKSKLPQVEIEGVYTHFAAAKAPTNPEFEAYTKTQIDNFKKAVDVINKAGFKPIRHACATAGTLNYLEAQFDMVRVGIGLMGLWPTPSLCHPRANNDLTRESNHSNQIDPGSRFDRLSALRNSNGQAPGRDDRLRDNFDLQPILSWRTIISEIKNLPKGSKIGYDITETLKRDSTIAICPIGYWHGYPRSLSSKGEFLVKGQRAKVLGRISMDMVMIDVTGIDTKVGDVVTIIGKDGNDEITAYEIAVSAGISHYELLTCLNPLIQKFYV